MQLFEYGGHQIRTLLHNGEPWFVAGDVCKVLGISNVTDATKRLDPSDLRTFDGIEGLRRDTRWVNESGLYDLVLDSRKPEARKFRRWVTSEVLPAIRRTGRYDRFSVDNDTELLRESERLLNALTNRLRELEAENRELKPKADVRDGIYEKHGGYTRSNLWKIACREVGFKGTLPEFNWLLHTLGITQPVQRGNFHINPKYYDWSDDPTYYNPRVRSWLPNSNPHFNERGKEGILAMLAALKDRGKEDQGSIS